MLPLLAKDRFFWTLRLSGRAPEETRHRARWKVARIQGPVSVRYQHALKTLRKLSSKRQGQLVPTHAFARHLAIGVAIDIYWVVVEDTNLHQFCVGEESERAPREPRTGGEIFHRQASERAASTQLTAGDSDCQHAHKSALVGESVNVNKDSHALGSGLCAGRQRIPAWEHQPVASYSANTTGTKSDIAATDQIRPIVTATAIPTINTRMCIPSTLR
jgi:hypothetical protein